MPKSTLFRTIFAQITLLLITSCTTFIGKVDPSWTPEMFFKNAQELMGNSRNAEAQYLYSVFLVRYAEDYQKTIVAEYELAFIHYISGNLKAAEAGYREILRKYDESPYAALYPPRFNTLCLIGLKNIEKQKAVNNKLLWRLREKQWAEEHGESLSDIDPLF